VCNFIPTGDLNGIGNVFLKIQISLKEFKYLSKIFFAYSEQENWNIGW